MAGTGFAMVGCSSDDDTSERETVEIDRDTLITTQEDMSFMFQLLNKKQQAVKTFKEGDNIIFRIVAINEKNEERHMPALINFFSRDLFRVYTIDGEDLGLPWDNLGTTQYSTTCFAPKGLIEIICPWLDDDTRSKNCGKESPGYRLLKATITRSLN